MYYKGNMPLEEYKEIVATAAGVVTIGQLLSPAFVCKKIVQTGTTKGMDPMPFIGGVAISVLFLKYGLILNDMAMIPVNILGVLLNIGYCLCFYIYTVGSDKDMFLKSVGKAAVFTSVFIGYSQWEKEELLEFRFGMIVTVLMLFLVASPLFSLGEIMRTESTESLHFPMILSGTAVGALWLLYGVVIDNVFMVVQNALCLGLSVVQLSLFAIYPNSPTSKQVGSEKTTSEKNKDL